MMRPSVVDAAVDPERTSWRECWLVGMQAESVAAMYGALYVSVWCASLCVPAKHKSTQNTKAQLH